MILGIDPAYKRIALVAVNSEQGLVWSFEERKLGASGPVACATARSIVVNCLAAAHRSGLDVTSAWIEAPIVGRGGASSTLKQAFTSGAVQAALSEHGVEVELVNPGTWKKHVVGHGGSDKATIAEWVRTHHPRAFAELGSSEDLIDAFCIALYGRMAGSGELPG